MPPPIDPTNAFKKATGRERFRLKYKGPGMQDAEVVAEDVASDQHRIVRHMVRKLKVTAKEQLRYDPKVGELTFFKPGATGAGRLNVALAPGLPDAERQILQGEVDKMRADFDDLCHRYAGPAIRGVLRKALDSVDAVLVGAGRTGVYFVPRVHDETLAAIRDMFGSLSKQIEVHLQPVLDMPGQRDWLTDAAVSETEIAAKRLLDEVAGMKKPTSDVVARITRDLRRLEQRGAQYAELLDVTQERVNLSLTRARRKIENVWKEIA